MGEDERELESMLARLPASILAAWGLRGRPVKGPRPTLSLARIVATGVQVAESEGLAAISMSRVAAKLGSAPASLYRHVATKGELLALMADAVLGRPPAPEHGWRQSLDRWAWARHAIFRAHPWVLRLPTTEPPATPNQIAWVESGLTALAGTRLAEAEKLSTILMLDGFVRSEATLATDVNAAFRATGATPAQALARYGTLLAELTSPEEFPALHAVIDAGAFEQDNPDSEFTFGLDRILDGIGHLISRRT
jgi:AcrR family transcriptional regulator